MTPEVLAAWLCSNGWRHEGPGVLRSTAGCQPDVAHELIHAWHPRDGYIAVEIEQVDTQGHHRSLTKQPMRVYSLNDLETLIAHNADVLSGNEDVPSALSGASHG